MYTAHEFGKFVAAVGLCKLVNWPFNCLSWNFIKHLKPGLIKLQRMSGIFDIYPEAEKKLVIHVPV